MNSNYAWRDLEPYSAEWEDARSTYRLEQIKSFISKHSEPTWLYPEEAARRFLLIEGTIRRKIQDGVLNEFSGTGESVYGVYIDDAFRDWAEGDEKN